ncbi:uncharacterized protein [Drosophila bipectinata]|uniref:uncharacterized protein n=1 Tax=Drosophila bipectinata TaxID=42026 RepID=UPI0038B3CCDA
MSGKQYTSACKLAQRGANLPLLPSGGSMRSLYHTGSQIGTNMGKSLRQAGRRHSVTSDLMQRTNASSPSGPSTSGAYIQLGRNKVRKVIGVKKTLVNQMQGMVRHPEPAKKVGPYKIYGKTRLFSAASSLQSNSPGPIARRWMSSEQQVKRKQLRNVEDDEDSESHTYKTSHRYSASLSATQQRYQRSTYNQTALKAALDISRSIQDELMVVDSQVKDMLNSNPTRHNVPDNYNDQPRPANTDPLRGWNRPGNLKHLSDIAVVTEPEKEDRKPAVSARTPMDERLVKPLRRRMCVVGRAVPLQLAEASGSSKGDENQSLAKTSVGLNPNLAFAQLGGMYDKTRMSKLRNEARPTMHRQVKPQPSDNDFGLMDVALARAVTPDITVASSLKEPQVKEEVPPPRSEATETYSPYRQPKAEKDFLQKIMFSGPRTKREGMPRLDELHYEPSIDLDPILGSGQISASQQVINKKFAGYRQSLGGFRDAVKFHRASRQVVDPVDPIPQLYSKALTEKREPISSAMRRAGDVPKRTENVRVATPTFAGRCRRLERTKVEAKPEKQGDQDPKSLRASKSYMSAPRGEGSTSKRVAKHTSLVSVPREQLARTKPVVSSGMLIGERRGVKRAEGHSVDAQEDDIKMPRTYSKESAVQRLGKPYSRSDRANNSY